MSRIKSSRTVPIDVSIIRRVPESNGEETVWDHSVTGIAAEIAEVPDIRINPKQADGYRSPSSYSMQTYVRYPTPKAPLRSGALVSVKIPSQTIARPNYLWGIVQKTEYSGSTVGRISSISQPDTWALKQEARMKVLNNIKSEAFDVAMVLAEIGKTANTAANLILRIGRSMDAIRRRKPESFNWLMHGRMGVDNRRPTKKFLDETSSLFLEWKYGIMPSVYDLAGVSKSLDAVKDGSLFDRPPLMVARASAKREDSIPSSLSIEYGSVPGGSLNVKHTTSIVCRADFTVTGEAMRNLSEYGIGLTSVATIAYDLTPFSFVANMVVPMAEIISAWGALAGVQVRGYTETTHVTRTWSGERLQGYSPYLGEPITFVIEAGKNSTFTRSGSTSIPFPLPFIRNPVKVNNVQTALALFTQLRSKPKK